MKKLLSVLLCAALLVVCFAGCATEKPSDTTAGTTSGSNDTTAANQPTEGELEPVHLVLYMNQTTGTGDADIAAAVNELEAVKALNVTVEFVTVPQGDKFDSKLELALASGEPCDIIVADINDTFLNHARDGAYADLTDLLDSKYTLLKDTLTPEHWQSASIDGRVYGVPTYKEVCNDWGFYMSGDFVEEKGLDLSNRNLFNIDDILQALKDDGRATFQLTYSQVEFFNSINAHNNYVDIGAGYYGMVPYADPSTVVNYYASEDFRNLCHKTREWYQNGLIAADILTKENYNVEESDPELFGLRITNHAPLAELNYQAGRGFAIDYLQLSPSTSTLAQPGWVTAINAQCENIDRALAFLEVWNTNPDVKNTITYGVEGVNYDLVDGFVDWTNYPDHSDVWHGDNSRLGNMLISYPAVGMPETGYQAYAEAGKTARAVPNIGFQFDRTNVQNEFTACGEVCTEYVPLLLTGTVEDVDGTIDELLSKLEKAGVQKIYDEAQAQWDAFYNAK